MAPSRSEVDLERLLDLSRYAEAEASVRALLASEPESASLHRSLARALIGLARPVEAVEAARTACSIRPDDPNCLITLSRAAVAQKDMKLGLEAAGQAVGAAPHAWSTHFTLSQALLASGDARSALASADEAARLAPGSASTHNLRGMCLARAGRRGEARAAYERALAIDPQHALAMNNLAAMDVLRNPLRAARGLTAAASADPQHQVIHRNLAIVTHNLVYQLRWVILCGGLVEVALAYGGAPRWSRTVVLATIAILVLTIGIRFVRSLPRGTRRSPQALFAGLRGRTAVALLYLVIAGSVVSTVALGSPGTRDGATRLLVQLLVIGGAVMALQLFRRGRRRTGGANR
jgi:Flp pilus assembly protein TadD